MSPQTPKSLPLSYQEHSHLSPSAEVRREGTLVEVTFHPSDLEPAPITRTSRALALSAAVPIALLLVPIALFVVVARQVFFGSLRMAALTIGCGIALLAVLWVLAWFIPLGSTLDALRRGRRQYTRLTCDGQSLHITSRGPFGDFTRTFEKQSVADVRVVDAPPGPTGAGGTWLVIQFVDGSITRILPDREAAEYAVVRSALFQCLAIEHPRP